jgi:hypothetical protein
MSPFPAGRLEVTDHALSEREIRIRVLTRVGLARDEAERRVDYEVSRGLAAPLTDEEKRRLTDVLSREGR